MSKKTDAHFIVNTDDTATLAGLTEHELTSMAAALARYVVLQTDRELAARKKGDEIEAQIAEGCHDRAADLYAFVSDARSALRNDNKLNRDRVA